MFLARVNGTVISTKKDDRLVGFKLLTVRALEGNGVYEKRVRVAVDSVGAGIGENVLVAQGYAARQAVGSQETPVDCAIVGIVDTMDESPIK